MNNGVSCGGRVTCHESQLNSSRACRMRRKRSAYTTTDTSRSGTTFRRPRASSEVSPYRRVRRPPDWLRRDRTAFVRLGGFAIVRGFRRPVPRETRSFRLRILRTTCRTRAGGCRNAGDRFARSRASRPRETSSSGVVRENFTTVGRHRTSPETGASTAASAFGVGVIASAR